MHPTDHVTDTQLNEYLDNETTSERRAEIELHLSSCDECAARLAALQALFAEIESLPDLELTSNIAVRVITTGDLPVPQLSRWLTLTATLQAALALIALIAAAPVVSRYLTPVLQTYPIPSLNDLVFELPMNILMWIQAIQSFQFPTAPTGIFTLPKEFSTGIVSASVIGLFLIWIIGNWWLLRKRPNSLA
jgi:hypothetical protein